MAKILCSKSGLEYSVQYFPISFHNDKHQLHHPVFDAPLPKLWKYFPKWQAGELTDVDSYLLFLAILHSTDLVEFRTSAIRTPHTVSIVQSNMESLYDTVGKILAVKNPRFTLPRFVISHDTRTLDNVKYWLQAWDAAYLDFKNGLKEQELRSKLQRREAALERLIKNPAIKPERYAHLLAAWADEASEFPQFNITIRNTQTTLAEYWKDIICKCYRQESVIQIPKSDIQELLEHCEEHIDLGSIFSYQLLTLLREALQTIDGFFGNSETTFQILSDDESVGTSNLQLLIETAPVEKPRRIDYPSEFAFLKEKMKWAIAQKSSGDSTK